MLETNLKKSLKLMKSYQTQKKGKFTMNLVKKALKKEWEKVISTLPWTFSRCSLVAEDLLEGIFD